MVKNAGAKWNHFMGLWELPNAKDEKDVHRKLRKYIIFNEDDLSTYRNNIECKVSKEPTNIHEALSVRELNFLREYMKTKGDASKAAIAVGLKPASGNSVAKRVLSKPMAQKWLASEQEKLSVEARWDFEEKLLQLKKIAKMTVPEHAQTLEEIDAKSAISAIAEANKMQGHYSAEKHVNVNVGVDVEMEEAKRLSQELLQKYKREY